jgi:rubrerythrin
MTQEDRALAILAVMGMELERLRWKEDTLRIRGKLDEHEVREDASRRAEAVRILATIPKDGAGMSACGLKQTTSHQQQIDYDCGVCGYSTTIQSSQRHAPECGKCPGMGG